jgi:predicted MPP superfamily phosphohydrolase
MKKKKLSRREFINLLLYGSIGGYLTTRLGLAYSFLVETDWIDIQHINLTLPNLPKDFNGYRLAQISDIHFDDWMSPIKFSRVVDLVNKEQPDAIAITGDIISTDQQHNKEEISRELQRLTPKDHVFAVLGNHDHWTDPKFVTNLFVKSGIINLPNKVTPVYKGNSQLYFCGLDDYWERKTHLETIVDNLPKTGCAILMVHEPDYAEISAQTGRFDLQISGHSHGGQVSIPLLGPPIVPPYAEKYPSGLYIVQSMYLYTNRGIGMIRPRVRFNRRPEITIFNLFSPQLN